MEILLVSQCDHKALKETRRILDQFACRTGERCWQTPITMAGLKTLHKMLRASARKNTSVACHLIGSRSELLWIVGDASRFDMRGRVPTQSTARNMLRQEDENDWDTAEAVRLLARISGLLHDLGKASAAFQEKLTGKNTERNLWRHEWQSARMFAHFVKASGEQDADWLRRLESGEGKTPENWLPIEWKKQESWKSENAKTPLADLPPLARAVIWLMVSHHRLPVSPNSEYFGAKAMDIRLDLLRDPLSSVTADWNDKVPEDLFSNKKLLRKYMDFTALEGVLKQSSFSKMLKNTAKRLLKFQDKTQNWQHWESDLYILHLARLSLMLADHHVSSWGREKLEHKAGEALANTDKDNQPKQSLHGHLTEISKKAGAIANFLENFTLPLTLIPLQRLKNFRKTIGTGDFAWQKKAREAALEIQEKSLKEGAFIVNMASTGCGKTIANAKIIASLTPEKKPLRMTYALGLRVLTRQTGDAYKAYLDLTDEELGVFVGGAVSKEIADFLEEKAEKSGSESKADLFPDEMGEIFFEADPSRNEDWENHPLLSAVYGIGKEGGRKNQKERKFIDAPILVCTVDHLVPATEAWKGGHQINPMLRLMSSDLILDELDDYSLEDMPALMRLVWFSGMLGGRVLLSSATLPETLVRGMFLAYRAGREIYLKNHGGYSGARPQCIPEIPCLWVDEFKSEPVICRREADFKEAHAIFAQKRAKKLLENAERLPLRRGEIIGQAVLKENLAKEEIPLVLAKLFRDHALKLHEAHGEVIPKGAYQGKKVSFGIIRMANIAPLYQVAIEMFQQGCSAAETQMHLCVYHSRFPLICRSAIEAGLDRVFNRKQASKPFWEKEEVLAALCQSSKEIKNHLFVVLASPVCEVGRDWDADWAIAEPSSLRSIIQLAGRVQRHRKQVTDKQKPNILLLNKNVNALKGQSPAYQRPGYEGGNWALNTHELETLLRKSEYEIITSIPRLLTPELRTSTEEIDKKQKLGDLELERTKAVVSPKPKRWSRIGNGENIGQRDAALCWWHDFSQTALTGLFPQNQPFREQPLKETDLAFVWDEERERLSLNQAVPQSRGRDLYVEVNRLCHSVPLIEGKHISFWNQANLEILLKDWLENYGGKEKDSQKMEARRVTSLSAYEGDGTQGWSWHEALGLTLKVEAIRE
ncbi:type I-F CRISPR-associated helicase Cas3 [Acetobacteraceae bacterium]|nr:type I-F CRISPR-associated helicase Cas3 [Acetobacteraceae bacterium]